MKISVICLVKIGWDNRHMVVCDYAIISMDVVFHIWIEATSCSFCVNNHVTWFILWHTCFQTQAKSSVNLYWFLQDLRAILDGGSDLPFPDGIIINGRGSNAYTFTVDQGIQKLQAISLLESWCHSRSSYNNWILNHEVLDFWAGKTYRFRISNVGLTSSINFRIQGHKMTIVEVEGTHTLQNIYDSLDVHLGQTYSVLVTADQPPQDYLIVVTTRFTSQVLNATSIFRYSNSGGGVTGLFPWGPTIQVDWSLNQARSLRYLLRFTFFMLFFIS